MKKNIDMFYIHHGFMKRKGHIILVYSNVIRDRELRQFVLIINTCANVCSIILRIKLIIYLYFAGKIQYYTNYSCDPWQNLFTFKIFDYSS